MIAQQQLDRLDAIVTAGIAAGNADVVERALDAQARLLCLPR
ncbi:hypothetical protein SEA_ASHERTHEMAN_14 [Gordonia phage Ashertheman]|uniref:Uncharacterized protein n=2 Tax=Kroosvirus TaxID=2948789 RepID=A0A3G3M872_9CAUD|nr:hypothetical protein J1764_gp14 [Gordonia phage Ashertheman]YP_010001979.1 hypothetical protein J1766_gp15 [Gordonia phage Bizzy]URP21082.1 hypothetical protein SEA_FLATWOODS_15 [Gordonia phage Flatwoods]WMI33024.1 hypothetical protein SEA_SCHOTTB_13 [Gordonia Phage SchottB]AXQ62921.1 hypothetical protein SEA_ASHERTHEMAN_14 [Gordonia phage Ashertheman]AYR02651.1 hypothetical protein SEA_BIZZY_15 [Gordonia phage Bizzy]